MMPFAGFCFANRLPANTLVKQPKLKVRAAQIENFKAVVISDFAVVFTSFFSFVIRRQIAKLIFENAAKKSRSFEKERPGKTLAGGVLRELPLPCSDESEFRLVSACRLWLSLKGGSYR